MIRWMYFWYCSWSLSQLSLPNHNSKRNYTLLVHGWLLRRQLTIRHHRYYMAQKRIATRKSIMSLRSSLFTGSKSQQQLPKVIIIAGPTATGKSDVAAYICDQMNGIIVSADSVQVYEKVQIGANKPTVEELERTPHILVNLVNHTTPNYNTAEWRRDAIYTIRQLTGSVGVDGASGNESMNMMAETDGLSEQTILEDQQRQQKILASIDNAKIVKGRVQQANNQDIPVTTPSTYLPVVVGGTMMYMQWLVHGRPDAIRPTENALIEAKDIITKFHNTNNDDWIGATQYVSEQGFVFQVQVQKLFPHDWYRLRRILEVAITVKELKLDTSQMDQIYSGIREGGLASLGYDVRCFFLCPDDRMKHTKIVDQRCETMICRGLLDETTNLILGGEMPDMASRAIGYRQSIDYLQRSDPKDEDYDAFADYVAKFTAATRQYSKRQMQWFRRDDEFMFIPVPLDMLPSERIQHVANNVMQYVSLSKDEYDNVRNDPRSESHVVRSNNAQQAKGMKVYQLQKQILVDNTPELENVVRKADACTHRFQAKRIRNNKEDDTVSSLQQQSGGCI